ncbi:CHAT domain-containing protein [Adhaeretor mobilis]|uniref:CHAT domain protein n=1 Tax=Adhaeretor mobilis TaxID=1930276 RepID=A0A517MRU8_9BACT|nr:hypothetical protein [Adhaeretor mobilis]QDS97605.1 CHAT domain protein [Adhaeretor mobilis]
MLARDGLNYSKAASRAARRLFFLPLFYLGIVLPADTAIAQLTRADTTPSQAYFAGIEDLYRGDYQDAGRTFTREARGAIKTVNARWIDSICYYALLGETYYQQGRPLEALQHFDIAANHYLQNPGWLLSVEFQQPPRVDTNLTRQVAPWGRSQRQFTPGGFSKTMKIRQGGFDAQKISREGGVVRNLQFWQINAIEVLRCTALTMRRRNEILGPLGVYDPISKDMLQRLSRGGAPPNHWSNAWIDILRGIAHAGVGEHKQALQRLERGTILAGQFDHPLTGVALLEQGRLMILAGDDPARATQLLAEASYSGYLYEDLNVVDEAFRLAHIARLASNATDVNPALAPAAAWARQKRYDHLAARLQLAWAEELLDLNQRDGAASALKAGQSRLRRGSQQGLLANWSVFLEARLDYLSGRDSAPAKLAQAVEGKAVMSLRNLQIGLANEWFANRVLTSRAAVVVYDGLLRDPTPGDTVLLPLDTLAVMKTSHELAFENWLAALLERKEQAAALEVADLAKRRRFHRALPWAGRLSAVRNLLATPSERLDPERRIQQNELHIRLPGLSQLENEAEEARDRLEELWQPAMDDDTRTEVAREWKRYAKAIVARESQLELSSLRRIPADYVFPPRLNSKALQARLRPGQATVVFHETPAGMLGFLFTRKGSTQWNCGPAGRLNGKVSAFLQDLGNYDGNREITIEQLASEDWKASGAKLYEALFKGSSFDPASTNELVIIPDGILWYVPFEALTASSDSRTDAMINFSQIRYAPTAGLAFAEPRPWRRVQRLGIQGSEIAPGDTDDQREENLIAFTSAFDRTLRIDDSPAIAPLAASLLDWLIVLDEVEADAADPLGWSPVKMGRSPATLADWMVIPNAGPQRILMPGMRTIAENGGKASRRSKSAAAPGSELFLASCTLMGSGAETILMSRWRVGGQTTFDITREFAQELPYSSAADAWQRSVQVVRAMPVDPIAEMRVKQERRSAPLTAEHPFFWAGYLVVDSGLPGPLAEEPAEEPAEEATEKTGETVPAVIENAGL